MREPDRVQLEIRRCRRRACLAQWLCIGLWFAFLPLAVVDLHGAIKFGAGLCILAASVACGMASERFHNRGQSG